MSLHARGERGCAHCWGKGYTRSYSLTCCGDIDEDGNCCEFFEPAYTKTNCSVCFGTGEDLEIPV